MTVKRGSFSFRLRRSSSDAPSYAAFARSKSAQNFVALPSPSPSFGRSSGRAARYAASFARPSGELVAIGSSFSSAGTG